MEKTPKISIGLPVYNAERYLRHSIESILGQTFSNFELVISDNASTDSTFDICAEYAARDRRIRLHRNARNLGAADNFNRVFRLSRAEYFKWAAYDDVCSPLLLERCLELLEDEPRVALCYPKTVLIDENGEEIGKYDDRLHIPYARPHERLRHYLTKVNLANAVFGLMRSSVLRETKLLGKYFGADYVLLMEVLLRGRFHELPEHLFMRRDHARNSRRLPRNEIAVWWDSSRKSIYKFIQSKLVTEQFLAINRASLGWYEKGLCFAQISRWVVRQVKAKGGRYKATLKQRLQLPGAQTER
ncbi:glycosyltransferase [bacterium]|nr:glycosyltransferase [bacterium]